ncbi:hypothetical protein ETC05_11120 [Geobacillus sp. BMUD]|uniref:hypothetical protein n=1 Tax=Geobacillus sp. BMUD TaxID=2508876 RepID=UPI001491F166|nr:hypothetical protein [Geobacillus sp. BMUD]NNU84359.1 hypothetical protein [Geobacillus sp. BMUD]
MKHEHGAPTKRGRLLLEKLVWARRAKRMVAIRRDAAPGPKSCGAKTKCRARLRFRLLPPTERH